MQLSVRDSSSPNTCPAANRKPVLLPLFILALLSVASRFFRLGHQSLWFDEIFSLGIAQKPVPCLIADALQDAVHPPFYYLVLHPFVRISDNEFVVRLPSAIAGVAFVLLMFLATDAFFNRRVAWITAAIALFSPFQVFYSQETRMYALLQCLTLSSTLFLYRAVNRDRARAWSLYVFATFLSLMTHYVTIGLIIGHGVWVLAVRRQVRAWEWVLAQCMVLILCLPWIVGMLYRGHSIGDRAAGGSLREAAGSLLGMFLDFNFGYIQSLRREAPAVLTVLLLALTFVVWCWLVGIRCLARRDGKVTFIAQPDMQGAPTTAPARSLVLWTFLCPCAFSFIVAFVSEYHLSRYYSVAYPAAAMILSSGFVALRQRHTPLALTGGALLILLWCIGLRNYYFNSAYFRDDWRGVSRFLCHHKQPEDLLVFNASWEYQALDHYYRAGYKKEGLPKHGRATRAAVAEDAKRAVAGYGRVWLILCYDYISDPKGLVREWFDRNLRRVAYHRFPQIQVALYTP